MGKASHILMRACHGACDLSDDLFKQVFSAAAIEAISKYGITAGLTAVGLAGPTLIPVACTLAAIGGLATIKAIRAARKEKEVGAAAHRLDTRNRSMEENVREIRRAIEQSGVAIRAEDELTLREMFAAGRAEDLTKLSDATAQRLLDALDEAGLATAEQLSEVEKYTKETRHRTLEVWEQQHVDSAWLREWEARLSKKLDAIAADTALLPDIDAGIKRIEEAVKCLTSGPRPVTRTPTNLPDPSPRFTARAKALLDLHETLQLGGSAGLGQATAVWADGGVGKTMLAEHYGWLHMADYPAGVFRINADAASLVPQLAALASFLGVSNTIPGNPPTPRPDADVARDVRTALQRGDSLLILDNIPSGERWADAEYRAALPSWPCRRLITTRAEYLDGVAMQNLDTFTPDEGAAILAKHRPDAAEVDNLPHARAISTWFGGLGAGLFVVGVYMSLNKRLTWEQYAKELGAKGLETARATHGEVVNIITYNERFDRAFDQALAQLTPLERAALELAAFMPEDMVPVVWLRTLLAALSEQPATPIKPGYASHAESAIAHLRELGLLRDTQTHSELVAMHRVLRETTRERVEAVPSQAAVILQIVAACASRRAEVIVKGDEGNGNGDLQNPAAIERQELRWELMPLAQTCAALWEAGLYGPAAQIGVSLATTLLQLGRITEAAGCLQLPQQITFDVEAAIGKKNLIGCRVTLAMIQQARGDLAGARARMDEAIVIAEEHLGAQDPNLGAMRSNLAAIQQDQGDLAGAQANIEIAIEIQSKNYAADHPIFAVLYNAMQGVLWRMGDFAQARAFIEKAIAIQSKHFPPDHPSFATRYTNLAMIQQDQGDLAAAQMNMERAIAITEKNFGLEHPNLARMRSNLATILREEGDLPGARANMMQAIAIMDKLYGPEHPHLAMAYNNLAHICVDEGDISEAVALWRKSYPIRLKALGPAHPHTKGDAAALRKYDQPGP